MIEKLKALRPTFSEFIVALLLTKILMGTITPQDCLASFIAILTIHSVKIVNYFFPKRPDLFVEFKILSQKLRELEERNSELERKVTALTVGSSRIR